MNISGHAGNTHHIILKADTSYYSGGKRLIGAVDVAFIEVLGSGSICWYKRGQ